MKDAKFIYVYKTMFKDSGVRRPFMEFKYGVLVQMNIAPMQLHPNSWTFVHCFEVLIEFLGEDPSLNVFFSFFQVKGVWKGTWCSLSVVPRVKVIWIFPK